jgi:hypothetical protein
MNILSRQFAVLALVALARLPAQDVIVGGPGAPQGAKQSQETDL